MSRTPIPAALRALCVALIVFGMAHSAGQALFRVSVGGIGLLFVTAIDEIEDDSAAKTDRDRQSTEKRIATRNDLRAELVAGLAFGLLCVFELASAIMIALAVPSKVTVAIGLFAAAVVGWRVSHIPAERARALERHREAVEQPADRKSEATASWLSPDTSGGPEDYLASAMHLSGALLTCGFGALLVARKRPRFPQPPLA